MRAVLMNNDLYKQKGFVVSTDKNLLDLDMIFSFIGTESYWGKGISKPQVEKSIENSLCFGVYHHQKQIGFARVITDYSTFAYLADVFIITTYRKQGLSKWLVQTIIHHQDLQGLRRWLLATAD